MAWIAGLQRDADTARKDHASAAAAAKDQVDELVAAFEALSARCDEATERAERLERERDAALDEAAEREREIEELKREIERYRNLSRLDLLPDGRDQEEKGAME